MSRPVKKICRFRRRQISAIFQLFWVVIITCPRLRRKRWRRPKIFWSRAQWSKKSSMPIGVSGKRFKSWRICNNNSRSRYLGWTRKTKCWGTAGIWWVILSAGIIDRIRHQSTKRLLHSMKGFLRRNKGSSNPDLDAFTHKVQKPTQISKLLTINFSRKVWDKKKTRKKARQFPREAINYQASILPTSCSENCR